MMRRLPIVPTLLVLAAVATMIALGVWQLQRAKSKEALIARYAQAERLPPITWPAVQPREEQLPLFRHATGVCLRIVGTRTAPGRNRGGESGYAHIADCSTGAEGPGMSVELGWSKNPNVRPNWNGGLVSGIIAPDSKTKMRLVASSAPPGLEPSAAPSLSSIPNNHRSYAIQWFAFAFTALLIYVLALRQRVAKAPQP